EEYDKVFNHLDMLHAPLEGKSHVALDLGSTRVSPISFVAANRAYWSYCGCLTCACFAVFKQQTKPQLLGFLVKTATVATRYCCGFDLHQGFYLETFQLPVCDKGRKSKQLALSYGGVKVDIIQLVSELYGDFVSLCASRPISLARHPTIVFFFLLKAVYNKEEEKELKTTKLLFALWELLLPVVTHVMFKGDRCHAFSRVSTRGLLFWELLKAKVKKNISATSILYAANEYLMLPVLLMLLREAYDKVFNHLDMLHAPLEGKVLILTTAKSLLLLLV
ncbi:hypothetical protein Tco_1300051, partial [Tanacetum coccineum]